MLWMVFSCVTCIKLLLIPAYYSTDFEVHRNWLSITHNLPLSQWYFDERSEWTLDYPPFFAYFEFILSHIAKYFDPSMLALDKLNYASEATVLFQRLSVIFTDLFLVLGLKLCQKSADNRAETIKLFLILCNVGLLFVDHIHFQYNGFLFGILLLSIGYMSQERFLLAALYFAVLLNLKHIFLYIAPVYVVFLFKQYCLNSRTKLLNFVKLASVVAACLVASFGPFITHIPQILSRLFPFKRGLTHAYWAPNFWALYNFADKVFSILYGLRSQSTSNTGGLVQEYDHLFLPTVRPVTTFVLTAVFMLPCLIKLMQTNKKNYFTEFLRAIVICCCTSFMFGWHVHEKSVLMIIIPLCLLAGSSQYDAEQCLFLAVVGHYSLLPLLYKANLLWIKTLLFTAYSLAAFATLKTLYPTLRIKSYERYFYIGLLVLWLYENIVQYIFNLDKRLPFLPLMLTSVYCSMGVTCFYFRYYYNFFQTKFKHREDSGASSAKVYVRNNNRFLSTRSTVRNRNKAK